MIGLILAGAMLAIPSGNYDAVTDFEDGQPVIKRCIPDSVLRKNNELLLALSEAAIEGNAEAMLRSERERTSAAQAELERERKNKLIWQITTAAVAILAAGLGGWKIADAVRK